jgi:hypothetical protein
VVTGGQKYVSYHHCRNTSIVGKAVGYKKSWVNNNTVDIKIKKSQPQNMKVYDMTANKLPVIGVTAVSILLTMTCCKQSNKDSQNVETILPSISKADIENQAWQMEIQYWDYVEKIDTTSYKKLWHDNFIGYPSFGDGVSNKSKIAAWIPELHQDKSLTFSYKLYKRAVNAIDDVVIVFYDADEIWANREHKIVRKETYKFTHTWKKYNDNWVILGGMAAKKNQDILK